MSSIRILAMILLLAACTASSADPPPSGEAPSPASTEAAAPLPVSTTTSSTTTSTTTTTTTTTLPPAPVGVPEEPRPDPAPPVAHIVDGFAGEGVVTVAAGGAGIYQDPASEPFVTAREGLAFAARGMSGEWIEVYTSCDEPAWVHKSQVLASPPAETAEIGAGFDFSDAVIVLDPGHGGAYNTGAAGPGGMAEKDVNLDIARRVRDLLNEPHTIDWVTGELFLGNDVPAAGWVLMTRVGNGDEADYEAGLMFRTALANSANANAMVAIHNNAGWEVSMETPGSDVFYQSQIPESRRFAKLMVEELLRSLGAFDADWVGAVETGAKSRLSPSDGNPEYYGILRRAEMPTVITEGAYISNRSEAELLATPEFRQAYAEAVYRALVRFLITDDDGNGIDTDPVIWYGDAGSGDAGPACQIPQQVVDEESGA